MKVRVCTIRYGNKPWLLRCAPTLDAWCHRHGLNFHIWSSWDPSHPDPKFCQIEMLREFLASDDEWMMYVDADVVVHNSAPMPPLIPGWQMRPEQRPYENRWWDNWCRKHFGEIAPPDHPYCNAGIWICDRAAAEQFLSVVEKPYIVGIMEQHHWNWWMLLAIRKGMSFTPLPRLWNSYPGDWRPAWMFHAYGRNKMLWLRFIQLMHLSEKTPTQKDA